MAWPGGLVRWAHLGLNQGPPACEAGALPLSYAPGEAVTVAAAGGSRPPAAATAAQGRIRWTVRPSNCCSGRATLSGCFPTRPRRLLCRRRSRSMFGAVPLDPGDRLERQLAAGERHDADAGAVARLPGPRDRARGLEMAGVLAGLREHVAVNANMSPMLGGWFSPPCGGLSTKLKPRSFSTRWTSVDFVAEAALVWLAAVAATAVEPRVRHRRAEQQLSRKYPRWLVSRVGRRLGGGPMRAGDRQRRVVVYRTRRHTTHRTAEKAAAPARDP